VRPPRRVPAARTTSRTSRTATTRLPEDHGRRVHARTAPEHRLRERWTFPLVTPRAAQVHARRRRRVHDPPIAPIGAQGKVPPRRTASTGTRTATPEKRESSTCRDGPRNAKRYARRLHARRGRAPGLATRTTARAAPSRRPSRARRSRPGALATTTRWSPRLRAATPVTAAAAPRRARRRRTWPTSSPARAGPTRQTIRVPGRMPAPGAL
jgi:hypothetical protein